MDVVIVAPEPLTIVEVLDLKLDLLTMPETEYSAPWVNPVIAVLPAKYLTLSPRLNSCSSSVVMVAPAAESIPEVSDVFISLDHLAETPLRIVVGLPFSFAVTFPPSSVLRVTV